MSHTASYEPIPFKQAVKTSQFITMEDGGWLDKDNHYGVRNPIIEQGSRVPTEQSIIDAKYRTIQFIAYKNILLYLHQKYKEKAYWKTLGITEDPYLSEAGLEGLREYSRVALIENEPVFAGFANQKYMGLCKENNLVPHDLF
jgi:hypothetical protein